MIRAFLFDIGNVILRFDFNLALKKLFQDRDPAAEAIVDLIEPVKLAYEGGRMTRADFQAQARAILQYTGTDTDFISAWEDIFTENAPMVALIEQLHGRYPLYLLSNTSDLHVDYIFRTYAVFHRFTDAIYSFRVQASKPHPEIYEIAAQNLGIVPAETFFIDDLLPNIETARALGFHAHHYHYEQHAALLAEVRSCGVEVR